ncbi:MAG: methionyl-tRNA formyltransferase [Rickettsiales bacterium]|nr:methionyl-tRNA formyltransferase [Rickettsiales bacterium]
MKILDGLKVGFFGTSEFSLEFLKKILIKNVHVLYVVTKPPAKSGRGKKKKLSPVHTWALENNLTVFTPESVLENSFFDQISKIETSVNIVVAYGQIIDQRIIDIPKKLTVNVHASFLPRWRGAAPIHRVILSGDKYTGVSIMKVTRGLDKGPILLQEKILISNNDSYGTLSKKIMEVGYKLLVSSLERIISGTYSLKAQFEEDATYADKIIKKETRINWKEEPNLILRKIRAFNPFPGAWTEFKNSNERLKIFQADFIKDCRNQKDTNISVGTISDSLTVKCTNGFIKINELQKEGKKRVSSKEFLNGNRLDDKLFK